MGEGGIATRQVASPLRLLAVVLVVSGLLAAAPAACWCPADDHFGQLLHARFAHDHASDHAAAPFGHAGESGTEAMDLAAAPAWSAAAGLGASQWQAGIQVLPPLLSALHVDVRGSRLAFDVARPTEHVPGPTFPPPR